MVCYFRGLDLLISGVNRPGQLGGSCLEYLCTAAKIEVKYYSEVLGYIVGVSQPSGANSVLPFFVT